MDISNFWFLKIAVFYTISFPCGNKLLTLKAFIRLEPKVLKKAMKKLEWSLAQNLRLTQYLPVLDRYDIY